MRKKSRIAETLRSQILAKFNYQCAYCRAPDALLSTPLTIDHILPTSQGGTDKPDNLCAACWLCNIYKLDQIQAVDPETGDSVPLFHPQQQQWNEHFAWSPDGLRILGITPTGRATVEALQLNSERQITLRSLWLQLGLHPRNLN